MNKIIKRDDEKEILNVYNKYTIDTYHQARKNGTIINDYLATPSLRGLLKDEIINKEVLDIGCGFGNDILWCLQNGVKSITGLEINPIFIDIMKKNYVFENITLINSSIYDIKNINKKFDIIYSNMVFDQIKNLDIVFYNIFSLLKKDGKLIFVVSHPISSLTKDYSKKLDNYFIKEKEYFHPKSHNNSIPYYIRNLEDYSKLIYENNFLIEKIIELKPLRESKKKFPLAYEKYNNNPAIIIFSLVKS